MKNTGLFLLLLYSLSGWATANDPLQGVVVPNKTDLFITLQRTLNSKTVTTGDKFSAQVDVPVTVDDQIVLPVGSYVIGHVLWKKDAGRLKGKAQLMLAFDTVILPNGTTRKMRAAVSSADGYKTNPEDEEGGLKAEGSQGAEVAASAGKWAVPGAITGVTGGIINGTTLKGAGVGAAVGAAGGALLELFKRGEAIELPKGSTLTIQLQEDLIFVKPEKTEASTRLKP
jgi:hypothetical protein